MGLEQNGPALKQGSLGIRLKNLTLPPCLRLPKVPLPAKTSEIAWGFFLKYHWSEIEALRGGGYIKYFV